VTVADGTEGPTDPLTAVKSGSDLLITWEAVYPNCISEDYHLLWGWGSDLDSYVLSGFDCSLTTSGTHLWTTSPTTTSDFCWFIVVGHDGVDIEGGWGTDSSNVLRSTSASGYCSTSTIDNSECLP
jgi:hypothetical protein